MNTLTLAGPQAASPPAPAKGDGRFFADPVFHFQTIRALMEINTGGADTGEVLAAIARIIDGDVQSWYAEWAALADRVQVRADKAINTLSKGGALMRVHNYRRTAEFLLPPDDPKRPGSWVKCLAAFYKGLDVLGVAHERISIPYQGANLRAIYFPGAPGAEKKPLVMLVGGFDSILEELYPMLGKAALDRGYSLLMYEGPGQGQALRDGLRFTPEWEKPTGAVLDAFLATHAKPTGIVLIGMSMGGYFAPRAAAFEPRIDGVVSWDVCFDYQACAKYTLAAAARRSGPASVGAVWGTANALWTMGASSAEEALAMMTPYTLAPVAARIRQPVLMLVGEDDQFIPLRQAAQFEAALVNAASVTKCVFDRISGGSEHCQAGCASLVDTAVYDWIESTFPTAA